MIHPTAIIHPKAKLDSSVRVGPYTVIDEGVELGANCVIGPHVYLTGLAKIGTGNTFHAGCVIGDAPQDLKYKNEPTGLRIGDNNVFREHVTIHRSTKPGEETVIGSRNLLMNHTHAGHNSVIGDDTIIASGALLAGHATVQDRAFVSGNCLIHQFCRVGTLAMMQGGAAISQDLPPFCIAWGGVNQMCGLNVVGLRRAGFAAADRMELKQLYKALFRSGINLREAAAAAQKKFSSAPAKTLLNFIAGAKRGVIADDGKETGDHENE
ncbi:MAG TPA: acyl-ACP--UDP-N-acetylglucosamine O-acyltransferase [Verrucomicrobiae bacterium]|jgi:UDP-N-acetylglucosamine acyltransferase|nr:acyl-ACP--UDP-N-acetylglucosamine O-acyltransferase [Verrucomicrobiae bacterium]